jgi:zinc transport system substrate-binding protein
MRYIISSAVASLACALPAWAEVPKVVTDIHPVHALVSQVMGDLGAPVLLLERGASEHDFQLRPSQAADLADADLVVWIGPELTPWLDRALDGIGGGSAQLALLGAEGTTLRDFAKDGAHMHGAQEQGAEAHDDHAHDEHAQEAATEDAAHDHGDDHAHDHGAEAAEKDHADHGHSHEGTDPHAWLDPANAKVWLGVIAAELGRIDAANAATYAANATAAAAEIDALDAEVATLLAPAQGKPLVVFHDAYGYFAAHYGLQVFGSIALGDATAPGAARLAELRAGVEGEGALCLFPEAQHDDGLVKQLADGTGATIGAALDPNGSMQEPGPDAYAGLMRSLATTIADCAAGS